MTALVLAGFDSMRPFQAAIARLRDEGRSIAGLWSPMPVALPGAEPGGARDIVAAMATTGIVVACLFYLMIWWTAVHGYAFDSGGRPPNSWPAFLVAPIELGALAAGFAGIVAFLVRAGLPRLHDLAFENDEVGAAACGRFVVAVRCDAGRDANALLATLAAAGAAHSRLIER